MKQKIWIGIAMILLALATVVAFTLEDTVDIQQKETKKQPAKVSVVQTKVGKHAGVVKTVSEILPRWHSTVKANAPGEITQFSSQALVGQYVNKGKVLLTLDDTAYQAKLADAKQNLASATYELTQLQQKAKQAKADWKRSGIKSKPSNLAMFAPQLKIAQANLASAKALVKVANKELSYTKIKAPFSGIITQRMVSQGQTLSEGDELFQIQGTHQFDLKVLLDDKQWQQVNTASRQAVIKNAQQQLIGYATITSGGKLRDAETRQHQVFLVLNKAKRAVSAKEFVHVEIPTQHIDHTLVIPASAYTPEGKVWYVDANNTLGFFDSEILFYQQDNLVVTASQALNNGKAFHNGDAITIATVPLASFVAGTVVTPRHHSESANKLSSEERL